MFICLVGNVSDKQIFCNLMPELFVVLHNPVTVLACENVLHIACTYCDAIGMEISCRGTRDATHELSSLYQVKSLRRSCGNIAPFRIHTKLQ